MCELSKGKIMLFLIEGNWVEVNLGFRKLSKIKVLVKSK